MISIEYSFTSYTNFLERISQVLNAPKIDGKLIIPNKIGEGFFQVIQLQNNAEALIYDFVFKQDIQLKRLQMKNEFYTLILDEVNDTEGFKMSIGADEMENKTERTSAFYLTNFLYDVDYILNKDVRLKGLRVFLTVPWMQKYLQINEKEDVLEKYISLKTAGIWYKPVDAEAKDVLHELIENSSLPLLFQQNRILRIVEKFFEWLYDEMKMLSQEKGISRRDIECAQKVEGIITNDITVPPPTIKELAREISMSESKLKKIFKTVYGLPLYEYYQKQRMQKARVMLLSGEHTIKDVGYTLGYTNLSNFTLAFKKEFNQLPSDVVRKNE